MYRGRKIAVVIPAYNVAKYLELVIKGIPEFVDDIIVVDDASTDETARVLQTTQDPRVTPIHHSVNLGVGGATVTGFKTALARGAQLVVKIDGDGQMDPHYLPSLMDPIISDNYGYTKGNRFLDGEQLRSMPKVRMVGSFLLTFLTKLASGYWHVFDPVNGYLAMDASVLRKLPLDRLARRYFFETDMLIQMNVFRVRVKDVAIPPRYNNEHSSMRLSRVSGPSPSICSEVSGTDFISGMSCANSRRWRSSGSWEPYCWHGGQDSGPIPGSSRVGPDTWHRPGPSC